MTKARRAACTASRDVIRLRKVAYRATKKAGHAEAAGDTARCHQLLGAARLLNDMATLKDRQMSFDFNAD